MAERGQATAEIGVAARSISVALVAMTVLLSNLKVLSVAMPEPDLDGSWMVVLGQAATVPARWGVDLAFTYGPASALVTRYFTEGYLVLAVPAALAVALLLGLCFTQFAAAAVVGRSHGSLLVLVMAGGEAAGLLATGEAPDNIFFVLAFSLFLLDLVRPSRDGVSRASVMAGAAVMGGVSLSKTSYGILALALFVLSDLRSAALVRRAPLLTPGFLVGFLVTFKMFGQRFTDLPIYLSRQAEVAAGYGAAMYAPGSGAELLGFLAAAMALLAVLAAAPLRADALRGAAAVAGSALLLLLVFKAAFVRQDAHTQIGWTTLGLVGLTTAAALVFRRSPARAAALALASLLVLWVVGPLLVARAADGEATSGLGGVYAGIGRDVSNEIDAWGRFLRDPAGFEAAARASKASAFAAIRDQSPLPQLAGAVDILPSEQTSVLANGLDYHPRPSFQDYSTYTAGLIDANVAFYRGASAPDWVLFGIGGLDDRYPTLTEGALWPELLRRYEPVRQTRALLALHRRAVPLPDVLGPPQNRSVQLGQSFKVPPGPVFARVVVHETLLGRIAAAVFRPPALALNVKLADGEERHTRIIPALGAGGFLISPTIESAEGYAQLAIGAGSDLAAKEVTEAVVGGSRLARLFYVPEIGIEFRSVSLADVEPGSEARALSDAITLRRPWRRLARRIAPDRVFEDDRLSAPAPARLSVPVEGAHRLKLAFGIEDGAWTTGRSQGVCFAVEPSTTGAPLWRRCLDPLDVAADRGPQSAEVALPPGLDSVTVSTTCPHSCDWGWSYWDDIEGAR